MSLQLARGLHRAFQDVRSALEADARDWTALSLVSQSEHYPATVKILGEAMCDQANRYFTQYSGHNLNVINILNRKKVEIFDPLSGKVITSTKSLVQRKYLFLFFTGDSGPGFLMCIGSRPLALFYLTRKIWIDIKTHNDDHYNVLKQCCLAASKLQRSFYRYVSEPPGSEVACIVGDERPTHFIRESMGGLQNYIDRDRIELFWKAIDYLIVPTDNAFILTDELFDVPDHVKVIYATIGDLNRIVAAKNLFIYRLMRSGSYMTDNLRNRITQYAETASPAPHWPEVAKLIGKDGFRTIWFSVEVEKGRLMNQKDVFATFLLTLKEHFGDKVRLIIDGWSPSPISINAKDERIISTIRTFAHRVMKDCGVRYDMIEAYTMAYRDKIKLAGGIDFFVTMHGSAAIVPSLIRQKPGITYHSAWGMTIDHEVWTPTLYRTPTRDQQTSQARTRHLAPFEVDIPAFRATLHRLIADHGLASDINTGQTPIGG